MPSPADSATLQAIFIGVDAARSEAEATWGADRLPRLVSDDLRAKLYRQQARWSAAYAAAWEADMLTRDALEAVTSAAGGMTRAWAALAAAASEAGHRPLVPGVWDTRLADGTILAVVQDNDAARFVLDAAKADGRTVAVYTMAEVANVIDALGETVAEIKRQWPDAKVQPPRDREPMDSSWVKAGDEIPFGEPAAA